MKQEFKPQQFYLPGDLLQHADRPERIYFVLRGGDVYELALLSARSGRIVYIRAIDVIHDYQVIT